MDEAEFQILRLRYWQAFQAYQVIAAKNSGRHRLDEPSALELGAERIALDALADARHALLKVLGANTPTLH
jgi:hypothetical protein